MSVFTKHKLLITTIVLLLLSGGGAFLMFNAAKKSSSIANLALKKRDSTFLFSKLGSFIVNNSIEKNESPPIMPFLKLFQRDDELYLSPDMMKEVALLLAQEYTTYPYKEKNFDGYVTVSESPIYNFSVKNQSTEQIGEQEFVYSVLLTHPNSKKQLNISWKRKSSGGEVVPIENCTIETFWVTESPYAGKVISYTKDMVMVKLSDLVAFFGSNTTLEFNETEQLLYIVEK